jgi:hypothetical protein
MNGRGKRIRTSGPCVPNAVLYQAELFPVFAEGLTAPRFRENVGRNLKNTRLKKHLKSSGQPQKHIILAVNSLPWKRATPLDRFWRPVLQTGPALWRHPVRLWP